MYAVYGLLLRLAWAALLPYQIVIGSLGRAGPPPLGERFGLLPAGACRPGGFWVHAVSVGEVRIALPLVAGLKLRFPGVPVHLTTTTHTGRRLAESAADGPGAAAGGPDSLSQFPFDLPGSMRRLLDRLQPRALLLIETEIWPNLLRLCERRGVPAILVNGRISERHFPRYHLVRGFLRRVLGGMRRLGMQSEEDAARILALGAPPGRVTVTGNLKFDLPPPDIDPRTVRQRMGLDPGSLLFVAGSTAPGEEEPILDAFRALRERHPGLRLAIAPRHPERFARAAEILGGAELRGRRWSDAEVPPAGDGWDCMLIDVMGVLPQLYAAADVVFVGGSLVPHGGHNVLEVAVLGKPVLFGPHMNNFRQVARALTEAGAGFVTHDAAQLADRASSLLSDPALRDSAGRLARGVIERNRGALERSLAMISEVCRSSPPTGPAAPAPA